MLKDSRSRGEFMFVNIVEFPPIKKGKDEEFRKWFAWSNTLYEKFDGFISRRLLKPTKGKGNYAAIVEHESEETIITWKQELTPPPKKVMYDPSSWWWEPT